MGNFTPRLLTPQGPGFGPSGDGKMNPVMALGLAVQDIIQKHNLLAQNMQLIGAQLQTVVEILKDTHGLSDKDFTDRFVKVAEALGMRLVRKEELNGSSSDGDSAGVCDRADGAPCDYEQNCQSDAGTPPSEE